MAQKNKRSLIERLKLGKEKSEGYARASLPSNRWELFWDIFKGRFWKLVLINLLVIMFFIPLFALLFLRAGAIANLGAMWPFSQPFGVGYQAPPSMQGYSEQILFDVNSFAYLLLPIVVSIAAVGVAGGAYVMRNMVWTEGIFVANDFWRGIKLNIKNMLLIGVTFSLFFYLSVVSSNLCDRMIAVGTDLEWLFTIFKILGYVVLVTYGIMCMHMIPMSVTYDLKFWHLIKNALIFTIGLLPHTILFIFLGILPIIIAMFGGIFTTIGLGITIFFGFSLLLLIWTNFSQWAYDNYINDKIEGAKKNRGIYEKVKESDSGALKRYKQQMAQTIRTSLNSKPIKPITDDDLKIAELPLSFNRNDIVKLNESKQAIYDDHEKYVEEHMSDPEFQQTEDEKSIKENADKRQKRIEAAKRELAKRNKKK